MNLHQVTWIVAAPAIFYAIMGNAEDGWDGGKTLWPDKPKWMRVLLWMVRNPFHNFCFHVVGFASYPSWWLGRFDGVFTSDDPRGAGKNWNVGLTFVLGFVPLPFTSFEKGRVRAAVGWRKGGAFVLRPPLPRLQS